MGILDENGNAPLVDRAGVWSSQEGTGSHWLAGSIPGWDKGTFHRDVYQPRYLLNNGRLFFDSPDALVPQATNGQENVYEYEPPSNGETTAASDGCATSSSTYSEREGGCIALISSGISSAESAFFDASESGDDVFFITSSKLVPEDFDTSYDVYDAHVCSSGGVSCHTEAVKPPPCTNEESCRPAPGPRPELFGPPPSATFSGTGNAVDSGTAARPLSREQKLTRALKICRKKAKRRRAVCERLAKRRYGVYKFRKMTTRNRGVT
jgi:hypothetical protein